MAFIIVVQELDLHLGHVDARWAFALAPFAGDAEVEGLLHLLRGEGAGAELAGDRKPQRIGAPAREVLLVERRPVGRAHDPARKPAAGAVVVAHLDGAAEPAPVGPVERRPRRFRDAVAGREAHQRAIVHAIGPHDLARIQLRPGVEGVLDLLEGGDQALAEHLRMQIGARDAVAVLAGMRPLEAADEIAGGFRDLAHGPDVPLLLHVEDRAHVQAADRGVRVPGAAGAVAGEELGDRQGVIGEVLERHRAILDEGDRLAVALHRHHDVEAGLAHLPNLPLPRRIDDLYHGIGEAVVGHALVEALEIGKQRVLILAGELDEQQAVRRALGDLRERLPEERDVGAEHEHVVVDELDRDRSERHDVARCFHRCGERGEVAHAHDPVLRQARELQGHAGRQRERAFGADEKVREVRHRLDQAVEVVAADPALHFRKPRLDLGAFPIGEAQHTGGERTHAIRARDAAAHIV